MENKAANDLFLRKLNTTLLSICTAGVLWMAKEVNGLDSRMAAMEALVNASKDDIGKLENSRGTLELRINTVEINQADLRGRVLTLENSITQKFKQ